MGRGEGGACSGAHSSPEQYTGLPATPPHYGECLATGTYRPMAAGFSGQPPPGRTAAPTKRGAERSQAPHAAGLRGGSEGTALGRA